MKQKNMVREARRHPSRIETPPSIETNLLEPTCLESTILKPTFNTMSFLRKIFGGPAEDQLSPEELAAKEAQQQESNFQTLRDDGVRAMHMGEFPFAQKCFDAALAIHADDLQTLAYKAEVLFRMGNYADALPVFEQLVAAEPDNVGLHLLLARTFGELGRYDEMREALNQLPECARQQFAALYYAAEADFRRGHALEAIAEITQALAQQPDSAAAALLRAQILLSMGQFAEALADTSPLMQTAEPEEDVLLAHAKAQAGHGDTAEAVQTLEQLRTLNPFHQEAVSLLVALLTQQSRWDVALTLCDEVIALQPDFAEAYKLRGGIKYHLKDEAGAADDLKRSLELDENVAAEVSGEYTNVENRMNAAYRMNNPYGF